MTSLVVFRLVQLLVLCPIAVNGYSLIQPIPRRLCNNDQRSKPICRSLSDNNNDNSPICDDAALRKTTLVQPSFLTSRNAFIKKLALISTTGLVGSTSRVPSALAKEAEVVATPEDIRKAFDGVRNELVTAGIPYMKQLIAEEKYDELLEFTKTYDQILRKGKMGKAKKFVAASNTEKATQYCNNVTFDLIGINRSIRPNAIDRQTNAFKYVTELEDDVQKFLALQPAL